jgi:3D (Asp-Asp-Asp) domain-containing protein
MPGAAASGRLGLYLVAVGVGLSPLLAGLVLEARGVAAARGAVEFIESRELSPEPRVSGGPRLPKGSVLELLPGRPERWAFLVERGPFGDRELRRVKRLKKGAQAWILKGSGPPADFQWPSLGIARRPLELVATGYDPGPVDNGASAVGQTRTGTRARFGVVAVDPKVIPLGSRVYVEGYGPGLAADVGGAIKGLRIDLCFNTSSEARAWGRRRRKVWIVDPAPKAERTPLRRVRDGGL